MTHRPVRKARDRGMASAEYAVATVAACGLGGILWKLLTSDTIMDLLLNLFRQAFSAFM